MDRSLVVTSFAAMQDVYRSCHRVSSLKTAAYAFALSAVCVCMACGLKNASGGGIPAEVESVIGTVTEDLAWERYQKIYDESSTLWKRDITSDQSTEILKKMRSQLGKVDSRTLHSATEQRNSGGQLQGHVFIIIYQTKFEHGEGMENFTLIEEGGKWKLARYFINSTSLK